MELQALWENKQIDRLLIQLIKRKKEKIHINIIRNAQVNITIHTKEIKKL